MVYICGVDEAGRGPVIGPMVIAIVCVDEDKINKLQELGVCDSKQLEPAERTRLHDKIRRVADFVKYLLVQPDEIDHYVSLNRLNILEAEKTSLLVFEAVVSLRDVRMVIVDSPDVRPERYARVVKSLLTQRGVTCEIIAEHKADRKYPVVSAASIVAKYVRDSEIEKLKQVYGDFGSGYPSDPRTIRFLIEFVRKRGSLPPIVRRSWSTVQRILREVRQTKLF